MHESGATTSSSSSKKPVPKTSESERCSFSMPWLHVQELSLAVTPGYSDACIPAYFTPELPMVLSDLSSQITLV